MTAAVLTFIDFDEPPPVARSATIGHHCRDCASSLQCYDTETGARELICVLTWLPAIGPCDRFVPK